MGRIVLEVVRREFLAFATATAVLEAFRSPRFSPAAEELVGTMPTPDRNAGNRTFSSSDKAKTFEAKVLACTAQPGLRVALLKTSGKDGKSALVTAPVSVYCADDQTYLQTLTAVGPDEAIIRHNHPNSGEPGDIVVARYYRNALPRNSINAAPSTSDIDKILAVANLIPIRDRGGHGFVFQPKLGSVRKL